MGQKDIYKYEDFTYIFDPDSEEGYKVEVEKSEPESVFKYYPNNYYSRDAVIKNYLFLSHPYHLNDSMDCSELLWNFKNMSLEKFIGFYKNLDIQDTVSEKELEEEFYKDKVQGFKRMKFHFWNTFTKDFGIISLTENPLHILMWSHYSSEKGFMVEFEKTILIAFDTLRKKNPTLQNYAFYPINYCKTLQAIDVFSEQHNFKSPDVPFLYTAGVKREEWHYENEWRLVCLMPELGVPLSILSPDEDVKGKHERKLYYPKNAIKSIVLGKHFFNGSNLKKLAAEYEFEMKIGEDLEFVNFLFENYNNRLFMCGEYENNREFKRSSERIELEKINCNTFRIIRKSEGFYLDRLD